MSDQDYLQNRELLENKREEAMDDHLETQDNLKQIEFGVKGMVQSKKDQENGIDDEEDKGNVENKIPLKPIKKLKNVVRDSNFSK